MLPGNEQIKYHQSEERNDIGADQAGPKYIEASDGADRANYPRPKGIKSTGGRSRLITFAGQQEIMGCIPPGQPSDSGRRTFRGPMHAGLVGTRDRFGKEGQGNKDTAKKKDFVSQDQSEGGGDVLFPGTSNRLIV